MPEQYVQFGSGPTAPASFRNLDAGPAFWMQKKLPFLAPLLKRRGFPHYPPNIEYCDVSQGFPIAPGTVKAVYCSHVLEHLTLADFRATLRHTYSILEPGGTFRFVLPDLEYYARTYLASPDPEASSRFMRETHLGVAASDRGYRKFLKSFFGRSSHYWMWDEKSMTQELANAGFVEIRRAQIGDNPDPHFRDVEAPGRWENCLGMECKRPVS